MSCGWGWLDITSKALSIFSAAGVGFAGFTYFHQKKISQLTAIQDLQDQWDEILRGVVFIRALDKERYWDNTKTTTEAKRFFNDLSIHLGRTLLLIRRFCVDYKSSSDRAKAPFQSTEIDSIKKEMIDLAKALNAQTNSPLAKIHIPSELN